MEVAYVTQFVLGALIFAAFVAFATLLVANIISGLYELITGYVKRKLANVRRRP